MRSKRTSATLLIRTRARGLQSYWPCSASHLMLHPLENYHKSKQACMHSLYGPHLAVGTNHSFQKLRPQNRTLFLVAKSHPFFVMQIISYMVGCGRTHSDAQARSWCALASVIARKRPRWRKQRMSTHGRAYTHKSMRPASAHMSRASNACDHTRITHGVYNYIQKRGHSPTPS